MRYLLLTVLSFVLFGCASQSYRDTAEAEFSGALDVRWVDSNYFLFLPNENDPFTLVRTNGTQIRPGPMYTDGGSIPRFLWGIEGYSPWGCAPAYVIHDWLFEIKHCEYETDTRYTFEDSVTVMAESLKAVMEAAPELRNNFVFDTVVAAVGTSIARRVWNEGPCDPPPSGIQAVPETDAPGELLMTIRFQ